jgi:hypothetical protein
MGNRKKKKKKKKKPPPPQTPKKKKKKKKTKSKNKREKRKKREGPNRSLEQAQPQRKVISTYHAESRTSPLLRLAGQSQP